MFAREPRLPTLPVTRMCILEEKFRECPDENWPRHPGLVISTLVNGSTIIQRPYREIRPRSSTQEQQEFLVAHVVLY